MQLFYAGLLDLDDLRHFRRWGSRTPGHPEVAPPTNWAGKSARCDPRHCRLTQRSSTSVDDRDVPAVRAASFSARSGRTTLAAAGRAPVEVGRGVGRNPER
ncbi:hypothetical protein [Actinopolymorpha pittospori]|uniref:hypothetical protein n=1 Tax=Actinopolymorpha pittospori TaxID=648752 RepID=UPI00178B345C